MALRVPVSNLKTTFTDQNHPQKDTLGTQIGPCKMIFGHFIDFGHFVIEIPIEVKKNTNMGRKGPRAKTKTALKSVSKMQQLCSMQNLKLKTFINKNPSICSTKFYIARSRFCSSALYLS